MKTKIALASLLLFILLFIFFKISNTAKVKEIELIKVIGVNGDTLNVYSVILKK